MPTYEYKCCDCHRQFDHFQSMNSEPLKVCTECGGSLKRLLGTGAGIIFKGSGFYETDYRRKEAGQKTAAGSGSAGDKNNSGNGKGKADSKNGASAGGDGKSSSQASEKKAEAV